MIAPSGQQHVIRHRDLTATVTEVGAGLRTFTAAGTDVIEPFAQDAMCDGGHGQQLIPWPNRVRDGQWTWEGTALQLPLSEAARRNASHGLTRWQPWSLAGRSGAEVRLAFTLHPQPGWPFPLGCSISYALDDAGLTVTTTLTNVGDAPCPAACGSHPYLSPGASLVDECILTVPADLWLPVDDRGIPTGTEPVDGALLQGQRIGDQVLDQALTGLHRDEAGRATVTLERSDGTRLALWMDEAYGWVQVFTGDTLPPGRARHGLAVEPMTAPPNALQAGEGLVTLEPGEVLRAQWGISL